MASWSNTIVLIKYILILFELQFAWAGPHHLPAADDHPPSICEFNHNRTETENHFLNILVKDNAPFAFYDNIDNTFKGIEISLVEVMAKRLNMIPLFMPDQQGEPGDCNRRYKLCLNSRLWQYYLPSYNII